MRNSEHRNRQDYLLWERPWRAMLIFSLPMMIGGFFQQTYTAVDSMVVGRYVGTGALAAIGACYAFTNVFLWMAQGGGIGASVIISYHFGEQDYRRMKTGICTALIGFAALSLLLTALGFLFGEAIMRLLRTPADVLGEAMTYLRIYFLGLPFLFLYNVLSSLYNALGESRIPLLFLIFSSLLNVALDLYFVIGLHLGIAGAAWATLLAQGVSALVSLAVLLLLVHRLLPERVPLFDREEALKMTRVALPSVLQQSTVSIGMMVVQSVVNSFGALALAGYSAGMRIENLVTVPYAGVNSAISPFVAQNLGARQRERVMQGYRAGSRMVIGFSLLTCLLLELLAPELIGAFLGSGAQGTALATGVEYLRTIAPLYVLLGEKMLQDGVLRGCARTAGFTLANLLNLGTRVLLAFSLSGIVGVRIVWIAAPIGWSVNFIVSRIAFVRARAEGWERPAARQGHPL